MKSPILVWSDGGSRFNSRKNHRVVSTDSAAWAFLIKYPNGVMLHRSGFQKGHTNNQEELQGLISALATLTNNGVCIVKSPRIIVTVDSKYIYNAFVKGWIKKWQAKKFDGVKNADQWKMLLFFIEKIKDVRFKWVKGHYKSRGNNFVDHLLNVKMDQVEKAIKDKKEHAKEDKHESNSKTKKSTTTKRKD